MYIELTLKELLQIALGCPKISNVNLSLLHSFFDIILEKLDSRTEKIEIAGEVGFCLDKILKESRKSPYHFESAGIVKFEENLSKVRSLTRRVDILENKLSQHLKGIWAMEDVPNDHYSSSNFDKYAQACEKICMTPEPQDLFPCKLLTNQHFVLHLINMGISPLLAEMDIKRKKIKCLQEKFTDLKKLINTKLIEINEKYKHSIIAEKLRRDFENERAIYEITKIEIFEMMLAKLEKTELTFLKRNIQDEFKRLEKEWKKLQAVLKNAKKQKEDNKKKQCISCLESMDRPRTPHRNLYLKDQL
uniref:Uncharacterized protein n=1 Tax=Ceratitis capitata TaxID=7213 RepID=W8C2G9_CERCA